MSNPISFPNSPAHNHINCKYYRLWWYDAVWLLPECPLSALLVLSECSLMNGIVENSKLFYNLPWVQSNALFFCQTQNSNSSPNEIVPALGQKFGFWTLDSGLWTWDWGLSSFFLTQYSEGHRLMTTKRSLKTCVDFIQSLTSVQR